MTCKAIWKGAVGVQKQQQVNVLASGFCPMVELWSAASHWAAHYLGDRTWCTVRA